MSKADLSTALVDAGGGTRRKAGPQPVQEPKPLPKPKANAKAAAQPGRAGTRPITVHYPKQVRDQLKILAVEQETTLQGLVGEAFNMLFAKYGKPEIAPTEQRD